MRAFLKSCASGAALEGAPFRLRFPWFFTRNRPGLPARRPGAGLSARRLPRPCSYPEGISSPLFKVGHRCFLGCHRIILAINVPRGVHGVGLFGENCAVESPRPPFEFVLALEKAAADPDENPQVRLFSAMFFLTVLAPLRFCDAGEVQRLWKTKTATCGIPIDQKDSGCALMSLATPRRGINSNGERFTAMGHHWVGRGPKSNDAFAPLPQRVSPEWSISRKSPGTSGASQATLSPIDATVGSTAKRTLRPPSGLVPRPRGPTFNCPRQKSTSKEMAKEQRNARTQ